MKRRNIFGMIVLVLFALSEMTYGRGDARTEVFRSGEKWTDTEGNLVNVHKGETSNSALAGATCYSNVLPMLRWFDMIATAPNPPATAQDTELVWSDEFNRDGKPDSSVLCAKNFSHANSGSKNDLAKNDYFCARIY
jgi:hypothetical protein